ncbi:hypothetical protein [Mycolicibacterium llatzerense]|uniref:hypothetical protein n=1 Tax=Mycolicibacterium llatzerense TaxID=280871 RepID=UPI0019550427|nr:hypothetical protein [Mycolicibacterium llatzerense]
MGADLEAEPREPITRMREHDAHHETNRRNDLSAVAVYIMSRSSALHSPPQRRPGCWGFVDRAKAEDDIRVIDSVLSSASAFLPAGIHGRDDDGEREQIDTADEFPITDTRPSELTGAVRKWLADNAPTDGQRRVPALEDVDDIAESDGIALPETAPDPTS